MTAYSRKNETALRFDGNQTVTLEDNASSFDIRGPFSLCFWMKTNDPDAEILASGKFSLLLSDGFLQGFAKNGSQLKHTEPFLVPVDQWFP